MRPAFCRQTFFKMLFFGAKFFTMNSFPIFAKTHFMFTDNFETFSIFHFMSANFLMVFPGLRFMFVNSFSGIQVHQLFVMHLLACPAMFTMRVFT